MRRKVETVEVEIGSKVYLGTRVVTGEHDLRQEIRYEELGQRDPNDYVRGDTNFMRAIARVILRALVEQCLGQGSRTPVKVEPKARGRTKRRKGSDTPSEGA